MDNEGELSSKEMVLSDTQIVRVVVKSTSGKLYIDVRKWLKFPNKDTHIASKKGLMMEFSDWQRVVQL